MAHIHELIDFVVSVFISHLESKSCLLVNHKKLGGWFPIGGHVELNEIPDEALVREIKEESGLIVGKNVSIYRSINCRMRQERWAKFTDNKHNTKQLLTPYAVEVHDFGPVPNHRHVSLVYMGVAGTRAVALEEDAHHEIRWFTAEDMKKENIEARIADYCLTSINTAEAGASYLERSK